MIYYIHYSELRPYFTIHDNSDEGLCDSDVQDSDIRDSDHGKRTSIPDIPSLAIERTCHRVCKDARLIRDNIWPRHLVVDLEFCNEDILASLLEQHVLYNWLLNRITSISLTDLDSKPMSRRQWREVVQKSPNLRHFTISKGHGTFQAIPGPYTITTLPNGLAAGVFDEGHLKVLRNLNLHLLAKLLLLNRQGDDWSILVTSKASYWTVISLRIGVSGLFVIWIVIC